MYQYTPVTAQPSQGGDLITRLSLENVNGTNYVLKRDWRRIMDAETRREGHVIFAPDDSIEEPDNLPGAENDPVILIHSARKPNGQTAVIVGTQTSLFRYFSFEDGNVYEEGVYEVGVFEDLSGEWLEIGSNFSPDGNRWEARDVAGYTIFNNGVDLPVLYDLGQLRVEPLYELREQGIAFAGTIEEFNGMLVLGDVAELTEASLVEVMGGRTVTATTATQSGTVVTALASAFLSTDVGKTIIFQDGKTAKILEYVSATVVNVDTYQAVTAQNFNISILYGVVSDPATYSRVQYRLIVSDIGEPRDFGNVFSGINGAVGDVTLSLGRPTLDLTVGDAITIIGGGIEGAALETTIVAITNYRSVIQIADPLITAVVDGELTKTDRLESVSSAFDLQDDGSAIIRIVELQGRLVVLKETSIFVGQFTGTDPLFTFNRVYSGPNSIGWKWMLGKLNGEQIVYAGTNSFSTFDLTSLTPRTHEKLFLCQNIFYDIATSLDLVNECWAAENPLTDELWFVFPSTGDDKGICYDFQYNTCSTIGATYTAAGAIEKPVAGVQVGVGEDWFIMGVSQGELLQYGLTNFSEGLWIRDGAPYTSILKSGLFAPPNNFNEVDLRNYVLYFSGYTTTAVTVTLFGTRNAHEPATTLFTRDIESPTYKNLIPTYFRKNYYQDQLAVTDAETNASVVRRVLEFANVDSRSTIRNNTT